ncbi:MAG: DUF3857 domain-containing protein [FCB group bacterium]|jgi:transglutaminase-like putative cysteine protease
MKKTIICLLSFFISLNFLFAEEDFQKYIQNVPGQEAYPEASAINVMTKIKITVNPDKSYIYEATAIKKILNYKGKKEYSDVKLTYNADYETVEVGKCFTVNSKGEMKEIPKEAIHTTENYLSVASPDYMNYKEWVINFPEVEPGAFIFLNYKKTDTRKDYIEGVEHLVENNPYLKKTFIISCPASIPIYYDYKHDYPNLKFSNGKEGKNNTYTWEIENTPIILEEADSPSLLITGCPIMFSTAKNWETLLASEFKKLNASIIPDADLKAKALDITKDKKTNKDKLFAIYNFIADNYILKMIMVNDMDFTPQAMSKVQSQKYGSIRELTVLFIAMAKAVGINECYPAVYLNPASRFSDLQLKVPIRASMNALAVFYDGMLISVGSNDLPFGYAQVEKCNLIIGKDKPVLVKYVFSDKTLENKKINITLSNDNKANIKYSAVLVGSADYGIRREFRNETEQKRKIWFSDTYGDKTLTITDGPVFENMNDLDKPLTLSFTASADNYFMKQGDYIYFKLPQASLPVSIAAKERKNPFQIFSNFLVREEYTIDNIPSGYKLIKPSTNIHRELVCGSEKAEYNINFSEKDGKLTLLREVKVPQMLVEVAEYAKLKDFITKIHDPLDLTVFVKRAN